MDNKCGGVQGVGSRLIARISHGEVRIRTVGTYQRAPQAQSCREVWGILHRKIFEKLDCLRQHFMRFEGSLIGNKAAKSESKNVIIPIQNIF